jgi:hypothetical protein
MVARTHPDSKRQGAGARGLRGWRVVVCGAASMLFVAGATAGCRAPTEVTVLVSTDGDCARPRTTSIATGPLDRYTQVPPNAVTSTCEGPGQVGSVVLIPTGDRSAPFAVQVVMAVGAPLEACTAPAFGPSCIVARRALHFLPHTPLSLPIVMREACLGVVCSLTETCVSGRCVSSSVDPELCTSGSGCGEGALTSSSAPPVPTTPPTLADASVPSGACPGADTTSDPRNCGRCGHDCGLAACALGQCAPTTLGAATSDVAGLATDGAEVFWTELGDYSLANGSVNASPRGGGAKRVVVGARESPGQLRLDGTSAYWIEIVGAGIVSAPKAGGNVTVVVSAATVGTNPTTLAVDATSLYWNNEAVGATLGSVHRATINAKTPTTLLGSIVDGPYGFALDGSTLYFSTVARFGGPGTVFSLPLAASGAIASTVGALEGRPSPPLVASGGRVAWASTVGGGSVIVRLPGAAAPATLAANLGGITAMAADPNGVFWVTCDGASGVVAGAPWTGGVSVLSAPVGCATQVAIDGAFVYWAESTTKSIRAVAR